MSILIAADSWDAGTWAGLIQSAEPNRTVAIDIAKTDPAKIRYALVWKPPPGLLKQLPKLEVIFNLGAGVDAILADESVPKHVPIVRVVDPNLTARMTEWVVLQVLMQHRRMPMYLEAQRRRTWLDAVDQPPASAVTVGFLGLGVLARDAARVLKTLNFNVIGWSRTAKEVEGLRTFSGPDGLSQMLAETDILVCLLPLTPDTQGILNAELFAKLKRSGPLGGPVLINGGRGPEQVEADILAALDDGTLIGASLDVFETEPLPVTSPLWTHPKVIITPHNAADSDPASLSRYVLRQIGRYERGEALENVVNRDLGY